MHIYTVYIVRMYDSVYVCVKMMFACVHLNSLAVYWIQSNSKKEDYSTVS